MNMAIAQLRAPQPNNKARVTTGDHPSEGIKVENEDGVCTPYDQSLGRKGRNKLQKKP